ncbi:MAG: putative metal-binding motif-containing protein, partial [Acidimicrobiia bacterium]|nr:putative metal-binding motif-containing protein [Acidimicrobiia bacterium]
YLGAPETPYDTIDQNCDGSTLDDEDGDLWEADAATGGLPDCDDTDPLVNPDALEDPFNGIDDNCDGQIDEGEPT